MRMKLGLIRDAAVFMPPGVPPGPSATFAPGYEPGSNTRLDPG